MRRIMDIFNAQERASSFSQTEVIYCFIVVLVQTINILIVNQSITDMCASFVTLLTAVVEVDGTNMSHDSTWDQFVCRIWLTRLPLWALQVTSTYGILTTTVDRYIAVVYPVWYKVRATNHFRYVRLVAETKIIHNAFLPRNFMLARYMPVCLSVCHKSVFY